MELNKLKAKQPITGNFPVGDEGAIALIWDGNKLTGELDRRIAKVVREQGGKAGLSLTEMEREVERVVKSSGQVESANADDAMAALSETVERVALMHERTAELTDFTKIAFADVLAKDRFGLLLDWEVERDGIHIDPIFDELINLPFSLLSALLNFVRSESLPKSQSPTMSGTITRDTNSGVSGSEDTHKPTSPTS